MPLPTYLMSNFPSVRPSLNLQFDSQPTPEDMTSHLASVGATFSRASIGTYTDANGIIQEATAGQARPNYSSAGVHEGLLIEESRTNLVKSSEDFSSNQWTTGVTVTVNQAISPDGLAGADKVTKDGLSENERVKDDITISNSTDYTISVFVKNDDVSEYTTIGARISGGTLFRKTIDWNSSATPTLDTTYDSGSPSNVFLEDYGNGWYRFGFSFTSDGTDMDFEVDVDRGTTGRNEASSLYLWGAQLEAGSFPTSYIPTIPDFDERLSPATFFDSNGVLQTQASQSGASAEGRIDHKYIDGQWVEAGLLLEAQATNYAEVQDITNWNKDSGTIVSAESSDSKFPDLDIYSIEFGGGGGDRVFQGIGGIKEYFSVFVKRKTGTPNVRLRQTAGNVVDYDLTNVTTDSSFGEIVDVGDGWFRLLHQDTGSGNGTYQIDLENQSLGDAIFVTGIQAEDNRWTSFIPISGGVDTTRSADVYTTATKQRSADVCYIDGTAFTDFYNQDEGTVYMDSNIPYIASHTLSFAFQISDGTNDNRIQLLRSSDDINLLVERNDSVQFNYTTSGTLWATDAHKFAVRIQENDFAVFWDGTEEIPTQSGSLPIALSEIYIGQRYNDDSFIANGSIKKLIYFPRALTDNELIKLTQ